VRADVAGQLQHARDHLQDRLLRARPVRDDALNYRGVPAFPAATISGEGVFETLKSVSQLVLQSLSKRFRADAS
jgi:hypothetical protein